MKGHSDLTFAAQLPREGGRDARAASPAIAKECGVIAISMTERSLIPED